MVSTLAKNQTQTQVAPGESRVVFHDLSWQQYQQILSALPQSSSARLTYALGTLEISMPSKNHERVSELINMFLVTLALELDMEMMLIGSTTLNREDLDRGAQPDKGYYIQNQGQITDEELDLQRDPPPDLVVEVDITHTDVDKNELYAKMGVPEFWRFNGQELRIYQLQNGKYAEIQNSPTFPIVEKKDLYRFLKDAQQGHLKATRTLRNWAIEKLKN